MCQYISTAGRGFDAILLMPYYHWQQWTNGGLLSAAKNHDEAWCCFTQRLLFIWQWVCGDNRMAGRLEISYGLLKSSGTQKLHIPIIDS